MRALAPDLHIKISGCPNGCGQHHIAGLGFQGSIRKVGDRVVPQYFVMLGGGVDGDRRHVRPHRRQGSGAADDRDGRSAARRSIATSAPTARAATVFFRRVEAGRVKTLLADLETMTPEDAVPDDFIDLGETQAFVPEVMDGECAT